MDRMMKPEWESFLIAAGAELEGQRLISFGNPEREQQIVTTGNVLCDLSHFGLIAVYGDDAVDFLQSQLSSDVKEISETYSQLSSYCSHKGRVLACFRLFRRGTTFYLRLPREMLETTLGRLRTFVLRARVTLEDASDALVRCGWSGPDAEKELDDALGTHPVSVGACTQAGDVTVLRVPGTLPRFELYGELTTMKKLWDTLNVRGAPVGPSAWALVDIQAGVPNILPPTSDRFVPQMLNLDLLGGVSFKKGCYPGQEVIARMHYLGTLTRRMYRLHLSRDTAPDAGEHVVSEEGGQDQPSGITLDAQRHPDGGVELLAVLRIADAEHKRLRMSGPDGDLIELLDLPYNIDAGSC
jgi:folate-binding protein YgfZ